MNYRFYRYKSFLARFFEIIKHDVAKNKHMKESLRKLMEETKRLENSDALQNARQEFEAIEIEANKGKDVLREKLESIKGKMSVVMEEAGKSDIGTKAESFRKEAAGALHEKKETIEKSDAYKTITRTPEFVKDGLAISDVQDEIYKGPAKLQQGTETLEDKNIMSDTKTVDIELHRGSKLYKSWKQFKDNPYVDNFLNLKKKYEESDNPLIEASRYFSEKMRTVVKGTFGSTEMSEAVTEICRIDPNFDITEFSKECELYIIPNILESLIQGELEILKNWCHNSAFSYLQIPIINAKDCGHKFCSKVLNIDNVDIVFGKVIEKGPVLVLNFTTQQIFCIRNKEGLVVEGDPDKILCVTHVWSLCRDPSEFNSKTAWRLLDLSALSEEQLF